MDIVPHYIQNQTIIDHTKTLPIYNPATGQIIREVGVGSPSLVNKAIQAATQAFPGWASTPPLQRARIFFKFKTLFEQHQKALAALITEEQGKTLEDAEGECQRALEVIEFATGIPHLLKGEFSANVGRNIDSWSMRAPLGVIAGITPFNFPCMVPMWMIPLALATGNTFILKPSEKNPSPALKMAQWLTEAGLPPGVFNVVQGDKTAVDVLLTDPNIAAVSFVGSTSIAKSVYEKGAAAGKRVQALGSAKNHLVVMPDADLDAASRALMASAFGAAGERCMAISIAVAVGDIADPLIEKLTPLIHEIRIGAGHHPESQMGPLISSTHLKTVHNYIESGIDAGATLLIDGRHPTIPGYENGFFLGGCLFDHVTPEMTIYQTEIFGPVLGIVRVNTFEEACTLINQHAFGNGAAIFTQNGATAQQFAHQVQAGMVGLNVPIPVPMAFHSFGGWKQSLFGDSNIYGTEGVRFYTKLKTVTARWQHCEASMSMPVMK